MCLVFLGGTGGGWIGFSSTLGVTGFLRRIFGKCLVLFESSGETRGWSGSVTGCTISSGTAGCEGSTVSSEGVVPGGSKFDIGSGCRGKLFQGTQFWIF